MRTWKDRTRILLKVPTKITTSLLLLSSSNTTCDFEWVVWYFPKKVFDTFLFLLSSSSFGHFLIEFSTELEKIAPSIHDTFFQWIWALSLSNYTLIQIFKREFKSMKYVSKSAAVCCLKRCHDRRLSQLHLWQL